jgi:hypothetical protein
MTGQNLAVIRATLLEDDVGNSYLHAKIERRWSVYVTDHEFKSMLGDEEYIYKDVLRASVCFVTTVLVAEI